MRIGIDGRRNFGSGIGRVTSNLVQGLLEADPSNHYVVFSNYHNESLFQLSKAYDFELQIANIPFFTNLDWYKFPELIASKKIDVFISPQFYISPFIECRTIKMVHDLWPLLHPEWIPTQKEFVSNFGKDSYKGILEIIKQFQEAYVEHKIFPTNRFIKNHIRKKRVKRTHLFMIEMMAFTLQSANLVIVPSIHTLTEIINIFPEVKEKIEIIPNFPAPSFYYGDIKSKDDYLLHVSKWEPRKNIHTLIQSANIIHKQFKKYKLILVGDVGYRNYGKEIIKMISKQPYKEFVSREGVVDDIRLADLYRSARVFLFPSVYEGFGIPVLEAMASGTPVVASSSTALIEVCQDACVFASPTDPYDIADKTLTLLTDEKLYDKIRIQGMKRARDFERSKIIQKLKTLIQNVKAKEF